MAINSINGNVYNFNGNGFGSIANIRKQAESIVKRVEAESDARKAEQERTGLIRNPDTGELVELSSISEETRERWEHREQINSISPSEAYIMFSASDPHAEEIEQNKALAAKATKIQNKMLAGKKLTGDEKKFIQQHFPILAAQAVRVEQEVEQLEKQLHDCKSKEEAQQVYMNAKMRIMSSTNKKDGSILFLMPAIDEAYFQYLGRGGAKKTDILI